MPRYLVKQKQGWYAVLEIPKHQRRLFGKVRFKQTLKTDSLKLAQERVLPVVAGWKQMLAEATGDKSRLVEWRTQVEGWRRSGVPEHEIEMASEDIAMTVSDDPDADIQIHQVVFGELLLLSEHVEVYLATIKAEVTQKTYDMKKQVLARFVDKFKYAQDLNKRVLVDWVENDLMATQGLSVATCSRIVSTVSGYWGWLERHRGLQIDLSFKGVVPSPKKNKNSTANKRKAFRKSDYQALLSNVPDDDRALGDLIILAAHTGCRIEELCSLKLTSVSDDRFDVEDAKTEAGWRTIPLHAAIKPLVARLRQQSTDGYLLSGLTFNKYGDRSNAIGKRFGRLKSSMGYGSDYVFHSFRKGVATQLETAQVPENIAARLLGHEFYTMSYGLYSGGVSFDVLKSAVSKLDWGV